MAREKMCHCGRLGLYFGGSRVFCAVHKADAVQAITAYTRRRYEKPATEAEAFRNRLDKELRRTHRKHGQVLGFAGGWHR